MKHLTLRDITQIVLLAFLFPLLIALAGYLETGPKAAVAWLSVFAAAILWGIFAFQTIHYRKVEANQKRDLRVFVDGEWRRVADIERQANAQQIYDQDADSIKHLDFKEKA